MPTLLTEAWQAFPADAPVPDLVALTENASSIVSGNVQPAQRSLIVEIADSSLRFDLTVKASLYARAGIREYWVVDVLGRRLICHRDPSQGGYGDVQIYQEQEVVVPIGAPVSEFRAAMVLPKVD